MNSEAGNQPEDRVWNPSFALLLGLAFCDYAVGQGMGSGFAVYAVDAGFSTAFAGFLASLFCIAASVMRFAYGTLSRYRSKRFFLILGFSLLLGATLLPFFVSGPTALIVCRMVQGAGFSLGTTAASSAAAEVLPLARVGEGLGVYGLGQAFAMSIAPALALLLTGMDFKESFFVGFAAFAAVGLFFAFLCRYESRPDTLPATAAYRLRYERGDFDNHERTANIRIEGEAADQRGMRRFSLFTALHNAFEPKALVGALPNLLVCPFFAFCLGFASLYGVTLDIDNPMIFFMAAAVGMVAIRLISKAFMDTVAPLAVFAGALCLAIVSAAGLYFAVDIPFLFYVAGVGYGLSLGVTTPLGQSVSVKNAPAHRWSQANALFYLMFDVGLGASYWLMGVLVGSIGFQGAIVLAIIMIIVAFVAAFVTYPNHGLKPLEAHLD